MSTYAQRVQLGPFFSGGTLQGAAKLYHYEAGTSTLKNLWTDRGMTTTVAQPLVADSNGIFNFFADGIYKLIICGPSSTGPSSEVLYTLDNWQLLDPQADIQWSEGAAIASASSIAVGPEIWAHVTGSTNISTLTGTVPWVWLVFDGNLTLVHSASLLLPESVNRTVRAGEVCFFLNDGGGTWRLAGAWPPAKQADVASATTLTPPTSGSYVDITGTTTITGIAASHAGHEFTARFTNSAGLNLLHNASSFLCPFGKDYRVVQQEIVRFLALDGAGTWLVAPLSGAPQVEPGMYLPGWFTAAPTGALLTDGSAVNCTTYHGLAKALVPSASTLGNTATSVGNVTANAGTDELTLASHGLSVNDIVHFTNSGGALPTGISANTVYYVQAVVSSSVFKISATRGGSVLDITGAGSGTNTVHNKVNVPDLRGRTLIGLDNLGGSAASRVTSASTNGGNSTTLGGAGGAQTHVLTSTEIPAHQHNIQGYAFSPGAGSNAGFSYDGGGGGDNQNADMLSDSIGGGGAHSNTQPWMASGVAIRF